MMTDLPISEELATRLQAMAHDEDQSVEELLMALIDRHQAVQSSPPTEPPGNVLLAIAQAAEKHNLRSEQDDISEHADEHAADAIAEHFKKRTEE